MNTAVNAMIDIGTEPPIRVEDMSTESNLGSDQAFSRSSKQISLILSSEITTKVFDKRATDPCRGRDGGYRQQFRIRGSGT